MERIMGAPEIYTTMSIAKADVIEEKEDIMALYMKITIGLTAKFINNPNFPAALAYIQEYFAIFMHEVDFEHDMYDRVKTFFDELEVEDLNDYKDMEMLALLTQLVEYFEVAMEKRLLSFSQFTNHYEYYIEQGFMDKKNYYYAPYDEDHIMDDEDKAQLLELFPRAEVN